MKTWLILLVIICLGVLACDEKRKPDAPLIEKPVQQKEFSLHAIPVNHARIRDDQLIKFVFNQTMLIERTEISGDLFLESSGAQWQSTTYSNDTLILQPGTRWTSGQERSLYIKPVTGAGKASDIREYLFTVDSYHPSLLKYSPVKSLVSAGQQFKLIFNESMSPASLSFNGELASEAGEVVWTKTYFANDTLIVSPRSVWLGGIDRRLIVTATDIAGNPVSEQTLSFTVDDSLPYAMIKPLNASILASDTEIEVRFNKSMDTDSAVINSDVEMVFQFGWEKTTYENDTLIIYPPSTGWPAVTDARISVLARDLLGRMLPESSVYYDLNVLHVSSVDGRDNNDGSHTYPVKSITAALEKVASKNITHIKIASGEYNEALVLSSGISLFAGLDRDWLTPATAASTVTGTWVADKQLFATIVADALNEPVLISGLEIVGPDIAVTQTSGDSSYAVYVKDSSALKFTNVRIVAGQAGAGARGDRGISAQSGAALAGGDGDNSAGKNGWCSTAIRQGGAGAGSGQKAGGAGGYGGAADTDCGLFFILAARAGGSGENANLTQGTAGLGGRAGAACNAGVAGNAGYTVHGNGGAGATHLVTDKYPGGDVEASTGSWQATQNSQSGKLGKNGTGGGGGGGSGGCDTDTDTRGAGGGGGGSGGLRAPSAGTGGHGAGSSFALFSVNSSIALEDSEIILGTGGDGGNGGQGGSGQPGGVGGAGGSALRGSRAGGQGGHGANGGSSGGGGGGLGGNAVGVLAHDGRVDLKNVLFSGGQAGVGGRGGTVPIWVPSDSQVMTATPDSGRGKSGQAGIRQFMVGNVNILPE